jgi:CHAD domain-containing protein
MKVQLYAIPTEKNVSALEVLLPETFAATTIPHHTLQRRYLDTFDWRLLRRGLCLLAEEHENGEQLFLYRMEGRRLLSRARRKQLPRFGAELGRGKLAQLITPLLGERALMEQVKQQTRRQTFTIPDDNGKAVARLTLEKERIITPPVAGKARRKHAYLWHAPVRGYDKINREIGKRLAQLEILSPCERHPLQLYIEALSLDTGYDSKANITLTPSERTDVAVRQLLRFFITTLQRNEAGMIADIDTEFTHDYRIAVRRSRTLLGQLDDVFPRRQTQRLRDGLKQLGDMTTPLRDLDVMLLDFDDFRAMLPNTMQPALNPALYFIRQQRMDAWQEVVRQLRSKKYRQTVDRWLALLDTPPAARTTLANAKLPVHEVADEKIRKAYQRVLRQGRAIDDQSPAEKVHTLRKSCKKLRYLLEFFQSLYSHKEIKQIIRVLKRLQDHLGSYQDLHVQLAFFETLRNDMRAHAHLDADTEHAIERLIRALSVQQRRCRERFKRVFDAFDTPRHEKQFRELFKQ